MKSNTLSNIPTNGITFETASLALLTSFSTTSSSTFFKKASSSSFWSDTVAYSIAANPNLTTFLLGFPLVT
jgi:hypothetical protein